MPVTRSQAIEGAADLAVLKFAAENAATPVARTRIASARAAATAAAELDALLGAEPVEVDDFGETGPSTL